VLVADSGRSVFLEEHFSRTTGVKQFRWEIPYACIVSLWENSPVGV
jgi:phage-related protein